MYLRKSLSNGKIYLSFVQWYRDETGKVKQKTIEKLGYLDDLKKKLWWSYWAFQNISKAKKQRRNYWISYKEY